MKISKTGWFVEGGYFGILLVYNLYLTSYGSYKFVYLVPTLLGVFLMFIMAFFFIEKQKEVKWE